MAQICSLKDFLRKCNYDLLAFHFGELNQITAHRNLYDAGGFIIKNGILFYFRVEMYIFQELMVEVEAFLTHKNLTFPPIRYNEFNKDDYFDRENYQQIFLPFIIRTIDNVMNKWYNEL